MNNAIKFNTSKDQTYFCEWSKTNRTIVYAGKCICCNRRTYECTDGGNDPRGILGDHAASALVAHEYSMIGPDVPCCFLCQNNDEYTYKRALKLAKRHWTLSFADMWLFVGEGMEQANRVAEYNRKEAEMAAREGN